MNPVVFIQKKKNDIYFKTRKELIDTWEHVEYKEDDGKNGIKSKPFINKWLKDKSIPIFDTMDNIPPPINCPDTCYNLWAGFYLDSFKSHETGFDISPMINHIDHIVDYNIQSREYLLDWMAHIIQYPGKLNNIAIALVAIEGVGKNIFTEFLSNLVGHNLSGETSDPNQDIFEKFSLGPQNKVLYVINEAKGRDAYRYDNKIKNMITAINVRLEKKGKDIINVRNITRYIYTSNDTYILNISANDRRFVIFRANNEVKNKKYFDDLGCFIENKFALKAFFNFLKSRKIDNVDWINDRPITDIYIENQLVSLPMEIKWFIHLHNTISKYEMQKQITREEFINFAKQH